MVVVQIALVNSANVWTGMIAVTPAVRVVAVLMSVGATRLVSFKSTPITPHLEKFVSTLKNIFEKFAI